MAGVRINKNFPNGIVVSFHYDPQLVEEGEGDFEDLRRELLSRKYSYTHVSNKDLIKIRNPLDQILEGKGDGSL